MLANLAPIPVQVWYGTEDPVSYLRHQAETFHSRLSLQPGSMASLVPVATSAHDWSTMNANSACNWLSGHVMTVPLTSSLIVQRKRSSQTH